MKRIYFDTSAYVKHFSPETSSESVDKLLELCEEGRVLIVMSYWAINEAIAALDRKFRRRETTLQERDQAIATILAETSRLAAEGKLVIIPVTQENVSNSLRYVVERHLSAGDALHLFSAILGLCSIFVATDQFLLKAAKEEGLEAYNMENKDEAEKLIVRLL